MWLRGRSSSSAATDVAAKRLNFGASEGPAIGPVCTTTAYRIPTVYSKVRGTRSFEVIVAPTRLPIGSDRAWWKRA